MTSSAIPMYATIPTLAEYLREENIFTFLKAQEPKVGKGADFDKLRAAMSEPNESAELSLEGIELEAA